LLPVAAVGVGAVAAAAWYGSLLLARDAGLATFGYDQAFFQQLVWNLDHGHWFVSSFSPGSFLALHFEPLLALPALVELVWPDPRALSLLAAVSVAGLGPAAFLFLRALTGRPGLAAALAAPLPLWPALQEAARAGFHPETMGVGLALVAGWAALRGRPLLCWCLAFLALGAKEDQAWNVLVIGLAVASQPATRRVGLRLAGLSIVWGLMITGVVMPILRAGQHLDTDSYYGWLVGSSPGAILDALTVSGGWLAVVVMVACAGGLPLLRPAWLALAAPPLLADLLSAHDPQSLLHLQYALPLVVPVLVAAAMAARNVHVGRLLPVLALPPAILALALGSLPPSHGANHEPFQRPPALARLEVCVRGLASDAPIAADDPLLATLSSRQNIRELTAGKPNDYLVIDREARLPGYVVLADRNRVLSELNRLVLCDDGRFLVLGPTLPLVDQTARASFSGTSMVRDAGGRHSSRLQS
jgi:uncharacterized membrane protein